MTRLAKCAENIGGLIIRKKYNIMEEKYILMDAFECPEGTLAAGSEIIFFRGQFYVNGFPVSTAYNSILKRVISDEKLVYKRKITKNSFGE